MESLARWVILSGWAFLAFCLSLENNVTDYTMSVPKAEVASPKCQLGFGWPLPSFIHADEYVLATREPKLWSRPMSDLLAPGLVFWPRQQR
ncbi:hypothetical protein B0T13DRAFT_130465 [Neurospora crassa]|nr:hypothetical protein B0T13DRAFT_130465 [Neurospora crassa]